MGTQTLLISPIMLGWLYSKGKEGKSDELIREK
jgi:hypothetical protein